MLKYCRLSSLTLMNPTLDKIYSGFLILNKGSAGYRKKINPERPTKNNVILYYRDPILCLQHLMLSPLVQDHISFSPFKLYENATKIMRIYTEWLSGERAWDIQVIFPFSLSLFCSANEHIADQTWTRGNNPWCHFIFRQNKYLGDDWWPLSPPSPYQFSQHLK